MLIIVCLDLQCDFNHYYFSNPYPPTPLGIIEHTSVVHNNMGNDYSLSRLDAPFGSVRFSNLRDMVLTDAATQSEEIFEPADLGNYAFDPVKRKAADTMGYAIFAEDLPSKLSGSYPLPRGIKYTVTGAGCRNLPNKWVSLLVVILFIRTIDILL